MTELKIELLEYITEKGRSPFSSWLLNLKDKSDRARIRVRLNRISLVNFGDCKSVGKGVSELRTTFGPGYRVYFGRVGTTVVILLGGGTKKSQPKDIEAAQNYWADYKRRTA
jgi:putative addiction module killer protein